MCNSSMRVVDLFAGLGGFSAGAISAGSDVILGVDNDPVPLKLWSANVGPGGKAAVATLGSDSVELPPPAEDLHVHFSSPCTELSSAKTSATPEDVADGLSTMASMLDLVLERGDYSWSCEQVSVIKTRDLLSEYVAKFPDKVAFATFDAADFGAPYTAQYLNATSIQNRLRLIAGPPKLIKLLQEMPSHRRISVKEAFATHGQEVLATHFKNQTRNRDGTPCLRSVEEQAFTVCASHALCWCTAEGKTVSVMSAKHSAILMGFDPKAWRIPSGSRVGQRSVGNALSVQMSRAIMQAAISLHTGQPVPRDNTTPPRPRIPQLRPHDPDTRASPHGSHSQVSQDRSHSSKICKRLRKIESLVRDLRDDLLERSEQSGSD